MEGAEPKMPGAPKGIQIMTPQQFVAKAGDMPGEESEEGVAEGSLNEGQYEMMMRNGQVKKFIAKDDADAKRIAAGYGAKSVIKLRGGVPAGKIAEQGVAEGSETEGTATLAKIAAAGDNGYDMIEDGLNGLLGTEAQIMLQDMYDDVSREHRLHPDDDFEQIYDRMMDRIESDYGQTGMAEAPGAETLAHNQSTVASNEKAFDLEESKPKEKEADYGADYQDMVARVKKLVGAGPLKTVWDEKKRVYRNVPTAQQPNKGSQSNA